MCSSYLLLGFRGVTLDRFSRHHGFQRLLNSADLLGLNVQLQGEEGLQSGRFFRVLLIHHRSEEENRGEIKGDVAFVVTEGPPPSGEMTRIIITTE